MRGSGILLHISSLPSKYGIGSFGKEAYKFVDFLKDSKQKYWQVLPLGPTSYGDSPYQTFSAFAGNPYFIDLDSLCKDKLLKKQELTSEICDSVLVNYERIYQTRFNTLRIAFSRFKENKEFKEFIIENGEWLEDYALFMAIKYSQVEGNWSTWIDEYRYRNKEALNKFKNDNENEINFWKFIQFEFFKQWRLLKEYANKNGVKIIGDMPIYVAYDSSDVWANPKNWLLDEELLPKVVAGVPPDYFAVTGQLWGNPIYDYELMEKDEFSWWKKRIKESFSLFDVVRIDHFRGFESYYSIPYGDKTAEFGKWVKGPGVRLFSSIKDSLGDLDIIAEDLGFLTQDVYDMLRETGYPGMKVMQFGFDPNNDSEYLPHNYSKNSIAYTGTHDNMTIKEWLSTLNPTEKAFCYNYVNIKNDKSAVKDIIKCCLQSVSERVVIPLQDYLELGKEGRFNIPSTLGGNWSWRIARNKSRKVLSKKLSNEIANFVSIYKRD